MSVLSPVEGLESFASLADEQILAGRVDRLPITLAVTGNHRTLDGNNVRMKREQVAWIPRYEKGLRLFADGRDASRGERSRY